MKYVLIVVIVLVVAVSGALLFAWSGIYNIAASNPHWKITLSLIEMMRDRSIAVRADDMKAPNLDDPKFENTAFSHYHEMCRLCHGAPGYEAEEFAKGLYPAPPGMTSGHIQEIRSDSEMYWIVKHGIKMTGMPAFGPTHEEEILWSLTAIAKKIPRMTAEQYRKQVMAVRSEDENGHGHTHEDSENENHHDHGQGSPSTHSETKEDQN
jgi:hypothetical protein